MSLPYIPEQITVHLGVPGDNGQNVTVSFPDYIKNVASSEIYPTWPESAIRANIYAQISYALNRIYTEHYRSRGYPFDITSTTANDQAFVYGRNIFDDISQIVDEIFNSYIRRKGQVEPLFAAYCDGDRVTCNGLSQWGTVALANQGLEPFEILQRFYGDDIELVQNVPVGRVRTSAPAAPLRRGSAGPNVELLQRRLNRISMDYPTIPKIYPADGIFGTETEAAVKAFQDIFGLTRDGIVGSASWYRVLSIYNAVKKLAEVNSEGLTLSEVSSQYPSVLTEGDTGLGVRVLQYHLNYIAAFLSSVPEVAVDGTFGPRTREAVIAFQKAYGLNPDGMVGEETWYRIYNVYRGFLASVPLEYTEGVTLPFPGTLLKLGAEGDDVRLLQEYLNYIARTYTDIPQVTADGIFGTATQAAVQAFISRFDLAQTQPVVNAVVWDAITGVYSDLYFGNRASEGQYPGYTIA